MLSVPLPWNDQIIGVVNVQTIETRVFSTEEIEFLVTIGALLGGIVEKGRLQAEAEEQLRTLTALDGARAELLAVVTHELRTPLAVVRAYLDLLADAAVDAAGTAAAVAAGTAGERGRAPRSQPDARRASGGTRRSARSRAWIAWWTRSWLRSAARGWRPPWPACPSTWPGPSTTRSARWAPLLRDHALRRDGTWESLMGVGDEGRFRQVLEHLLENEVKYSPAGRLRQRGRLARGRRDSASTSPTTGRASRRPSGSPSSRPTFERPTGPAAPGSACTRRG